MPFENNKKVIRYYRKSQYGTEREFIHPTDAGDAQIVRQLTGRATIDSVTRELLRDLTGGYIEFREELAPYVPDAQERAHLWAEQD